MSVAARTPTFSIIIEWENVRFIDLNRTREMLRVLRTELKTIQPPLRPPEVLFLYTVQNVPEALVRQVLADDFKPEDVPAITRVIPTDNLRYYEQKNFGAAHSSGEIKILLDSDVLPEAGWLSAMLKSFEDPRVHVVAGQTYMAYDSFYTRAFALFWCWPLRDTTPGLTPSKIFHANNVAYRSEIYDAYPFPNLHGPIRQIYNAFGAQRMIWGSDITRLTSTYAENLRLFTEAIDFFSREDLEWIMGRTLATRCNWPA